MACCQGIFGCGGVRWGGGGRLHKLVAFVLFISFPNQLMRWPDHVIVEIYSLRYTLGGHAVYVHIVENSGIGTRTKR